MEYEEQDVEQIIAVVKGIILRGIGINREIAE
jgi:hypothetical protein